MNTQPLTVDTLRGSVIAVPPLARNQDYSLNQHENERLVRHIEAGGVSTLLYGGNANLYHVALSEYAGLLQLLCDVAAPATLVIPSVGPAYGTMMDQAGILQAFPFPTAMVLPHKEISTSAGIARAIHEFTRVFQRPVVLYIKHENYVLADDVVRLMNDGVISAIKYAIVRANPTRDDYLRALVDALGPDRIVSGMGEQPAVTHLATSDCRDSRRVACVCGRIFRRVCCAPYRATTLQWRNACVMHFDRSRICATQFIPFAYCMKRSRLARSPRQDRYCRA